MPEPPFHTSQTDDDGREFAIAQHLDARGLTCPLPALKTVEKCLELPIGEVLEIVGDWPGSKLEVPYAVTGQPGLEVLRIVESAQPDDDTWWIYVRRKS